MPAVRAQQFDSVVLMLDRGAPVYLTVKETSPYEHPIYIAVCLESEELVLLLASRGADLDCCESTGSTLLAYATVLSSRTMVTTLLALGANVDAAPVWDRGMTALREAVDNCPVCDLTVMEIMVAAGATWLCVVRCTRRGVSKVEFDGDNGECRCRYRCSLSTDSRVGNNAERVLRPVLSAV